MAGATPEQAYPHISFRWRTRNWWARLTRVPPECVHLEEEISWMATYVPDTVYLKGKAAVQRRPARPEVSLCRACLLGELEVELRKYQGRVIAFEPDGDAFSQYFFVGRREFSAAGLLPDVAEAIERRLKQPAGSCVRCGYNANWLWIPRNQVESLDNVGSITTAAGEAFCATHGAQKLSQAFAAVSEANLLYVNAPYGEAGAYLWI
jgi:hypothetical protein